MQLAEGYDNVFTSTSSMVRRLVAEIQHKDIQKSSYEVRKRVGKIGELVAYDYENHSLDEGYHNESLQITTGNGGLKAKVLGLRAEEPVIMNVLRSANDMVQGVREVFKEAPVIFADAKRVSGTYKDGNMQIEVNYMSPPMYGEDPISLDGRVLLLPDPMGATMCSAEEVVEEAVRRYGEPREVIFMNVLAAKPGVDRIVEAMKERNQPFQLYTAKMDPELDDRGYICPGAGDLGDLQHNGGKTLFNVLSEVFTEGHQAK